MQKNISDLQFITETFSNSQNIYYFCQYFSYSLFDSDSIIINYTLQITFIVRNGIVTIVKEKSFKLFLGFQKKPFVVLSVMLVFLAAFAQKSESGLDFWRKCPNAHYGRNQFQKLTNFKALIVLQFLRNQFLVLCWGIYQIKR